MCRKGVMAQIRLVSVLFMALFLTTLALTEGICTKAYAEPYKVSFVSSKDLSGTGPSVLYQPANPGANSQIGIMIMHPSGNHLEHPTVVGSPDPGTSSPNGPGLASLGYTVLALTSTMSSDDLLDTDKLFLQVSKGVAYLRKVVGNSGKVVLLGHSGGGPTMAGYQFIAENGVKACQGPEKIVPCPDSLAGMPPADGLIILDSSLGFGAITLVTLDPAVADENKATQLTPSLNLYNPQNGFHPPTGGTYSSTFIQNYTAAQAKRMEKLIQTALGRLAQLNTGNGEYENDEPFDIPGSNIGNPQMWSLDLNVWASTRDPHWLVKSNGGIVYGVVPSLRSPYTTTSSPTPKSTGGYLTTVRRFLNTWACRPLPDYGYGANYVRGIDYQSTYNSPVAAVEGIKKPLLILGMSAGQLLVSDETIFQHAVSTDKRLIFIEGATHMTTPISAQYGNTTTTTVLEIDKWLHGVRY
jgi:hypothetical protein